MWLAVAVRILVGSQYPKRITLYENGASAGGQSATIEEPAASYEELLATFQQQVSSEPFETLLANSPVFFTGRGAGVTNSDRIENGDEIFVVPRWNQFVWPMKHIGHRVAVDGVYNRDGGPVELETIETRPRWVTDVPHCSG